MSVTADRETNGAGGWVGQALRRREDPPFLMGQGSFVDDLTLPGVLHVAVVRSPEAHANITSIDTSGAEAGDAIARASEQAADGTHPPADLNASADYKRHLAGVLTRRALSAAVTA